MSSPELPDDLRGWPNDPFELLGVARGTSEPDIKRAYTRLIRRFKPEHHPDEFRRVREAYEACLTQGRWFFPPTEFVEPVVVPPSDVRQEPIEPIAAPEARDESESRLPENPVEPVRFEVPQFSRQSPRIDDAERLWRLAVEGHNEEAYRELKSLATAHPDRVDLFLRLYWLLALTPSLDADLTRHNWLADALVRSKLNGSAVELYRRELGIDPDVALYGPYLELLAAEAHPNDLLHVGRLRLFAAGRSRSWGPADVDLKVLAKRIPLYNEAAWLSFLVTASDWTAWEQPWPLSASIRDELDHLKHLELAHAESFDRIEETIRLSTRLAKDWSDVADALLTPAWQRLLASAWAGYGDVAAADVNSAAEEVAADPSGALRRVDRFQRDFGTPLIAILARALERTLRSQRRLNTDFPPDLIRATAMRLPGGWDRGYSQLRSDLLDFLCDYSLHPDEFIEVCELHPEYRIRELMQSIRDDHSLRLVWLAIVLTI
jgi:hypothetical protein